MKWLVAGPDETGYGIATTVAPGYRLRGVTTLVGVAPVRPDLRWPSTALLGMLSTDLTGGPGTMRTAEIDVDAARFIGATIRLFEAEVLVVRVLSRVIGDRSEAPALVAAFHARFQRTIVLVAQDRNGTPTYFGPGPIAAVLARIPFDALPWRRYRYQPPKPKLLPIPVDPPPRDDSGDESAQRWLRAEEHRTATGHRRQTRTL